MQAAAIGPYRQKKSGVSRKRVKNDEKKVKKDIQRGGLRQEIKDMKRFDVLKLRFFKISFHCKIIKLVTNSCIIIHFIFLGNKEFSALSVLI